MDDNRDAYIRQKFADFREDMITEMAHLKAEMAGLYRALRECGMTEEAIAEIRADSAGDFLATRAALRKRHGLPAA